LAYPQKILVLSDSTLIGLY